MKTIGVLALQGAFREHRLMMEKCGAKTVEIKKPEHLNKCTGLIIPGGESTTIWKLLEEWDIATAIRKRAVEGMPIFGTCAGMILLAKKIIGSEQSSLRLMDIEVARNAYGRQINSFEVDLSIKGLGEPFRAVFIRAPYVTDAGENVEVLCKHEDKVVMVKQDNLLACSFHPELTDDLRVHEFFLQMV